ncbi:MAG: hypothetical protein AAGE84_21860, partial [Cyanobacteria bacterium P01_G01_bin.39]
SNTMSSSKNKIPLGLLLQNADLISDEQLQNALDIQSQFDQMKLGEILVLQEGLRAKTIDFFVNQWQEITNQGQQYPIGHYLKIAALLNEQQIKIILQEQKNNSQKFGVLAAQKGWIKQSTVEFLLDNLLQPAPLISFSSLEEYNAKTLHLEKKYADASLILGRIIAWTGGNKILTQDICQVFADSDFNIPAGSEVNAVDQFVEGSLIRNWRKSKNAEHIRSLEHNLVNNVRCEPKLLLQEYREILLGDHQQYQDSREQNELLHLGLVVKKGGYLQVGNIIFQQVFNQEFIAQEIKSLSVDQQPQPQPQQSNNDTAITLNTKPTASNRITEYIPVKSSSKDSDESNNNVDIYPVPVPNANSASTESQGNIPEPITKIASIVTLTAIALIIPLVLTVNNYYSSLLQPNRRTKIIRDSLSKEEELQKYCNQLDLSDLSTSLNLIAKLEREKQILLQDSDNNSAAFPNDCARALNRYRVLAAPLLGKENRILEAIRNLCKVPENSEVYLDAEVWLKRWYNSSNWGEETKFYLEEFTKYNDSDCPAAHFTEYDN